MARQARVAPGGQVYHVLNRAVARLRIFETAGDYQAFERVIQEGLERHPVRLLGWVVMPNHWHLVVWPRKEGELSAFVRWVTHTHVMRWHRFHETVSTGPLYQGRFKSFMVEADGHLPTVMRYVQRNPVRGGLAERGEDWRWGSLWHQMKGGAMAECVARPPVEVDGGWTGQAWLERVRRAETAAELEAVRSSVKRGRPLGSAEWTQRVVRRLGLEHTVRAAHRPREEK